VYPESNSNLADGESTAAVRSQRRGAVPHRPEADRATGVEVTSMTQRQNSCIVV
jgi:hypothetical protein